MFPLPQAQLLPLEAQPTLVPRPHRGWKAGATVPPSAAEQWSAVRPAASAPLHSAAPPGEPCAGQVLGPAPVVGKKKVNPTNCCFSNPVSTRLPY